MITTLRPRIRLILLLNFATLGVVSSFCHTIRRINYIPSHLYTSKNEQVTIRHNPLTKLEAKKKGGNKMSATAFTGYLIHQQYQQTALVSAISTGCVALFSYIKIIDVVISSGCAALFSSVKVIIAKTASGRLIRR